MRNNKTISGLTLVEVLVISPIIILLIGAFIAVIVTLTGDVISNRSSNAQSYTIQDALNRIEQDAKLSTDFLATNNIALTSPQGIDDATGVFHNADTTYGQMLILNMYATTKNPSDSSKNTLYTIEPNACSSGLASQNAPLMFNVVYFVKNGNLYRRVIATSDYATNSCNAATKTITLPWQQPTCSAGYAAAFCKTQDELLVTGIAATDGFLVNYLSSSSSSIITNANDAAKSDADRQTSLNDAATVKITINTGITAAGRSTSQSGTIRAAKYKKEALPAAFSIPDSFIKTWGGDKSERGYDIAQTSDGNYAVAGYTWTNAVGGASDTDILVIKYKPNGTILWTRQWGGASQEYAYAIGATSDNGYIVTGRTQSSAAGDVITIKYNSDGSIAWQKSWGGAALDAGVGVIQTSDGGYAVAGYTASIGANGNDVLLLKYTSNGTLSWSRVWSGTAADSAINLMQTSDNGYVLTGQTATYGTTVPDALLIKYDASGNFLWNKTWGGAGNNEYFRDAVASSDGGIVAAGYSNSFNIGLLDAVIVKFDSSGALVWATAWGGTLDDIAGNIIRTPDNNYIISGYTSSFDNRGIDTFIAKFTNTGTISWSKAFGDVGDDYGWGLINNTDGGFTYTGQTAYGTGLGDVYISKYKSDGSITNCNSPMCRTVNATSVSITTSTQTTPSATKTSDPVGPSDLIPSFSYPTPQGIPSVLAQP